MNDTRSMHLRCLSATMLFRARTGARAVPAPRIFDAWALKVRRRNLQVRACPRVAMSCAEVGSDKGRRLSVSNGPADTTLCTAPQNVRALHILARTRCRRNQRLFATIVATWHKTARQSLEASRSQALQTMIDQIHEYQVSYSRLTCAPDLIRQRKLSSFPDIYLCRAVCSWKRGCRGRV